MIAPGTLMLDVHKGERFAMKGLSDVGRIKSIIDRRNEQKFLM